MSHSITTSATLAPRINSATLRCGDRAFYGNMTAFIDYLTLLLAPLAEIHSSIHVSVICLRVVAFLPLFNSSHAAFRHALLFGLGDGKLSAHLCFGNVTNPFSIMSRSISPIDSCILRFVNALPSASERLSP